MCAGITVFNSMRNMGVTAGEVVAIQGVGGLGHLAIQFANKMGFKVVALSTGDDKEKLAKDLGAHVYINISKSDPVEELKKLGGAKLVVATAPHAKSIDPLVKALKVQGKVLILAIPQENLSINAMDLIANRVSVCGWASGDCRDSEDTLNFAVTTGVKPMIETFSIDQAQEALDKMLSNKAKFRGVFKF